MAVLQHGYYVLTLDTGKRMSRYGGRPHSLLMKCPVAPVLPSQELIQCDPEFIQVGDQQMMKLLLSFLDILHSEIFVCLQVTRQLPRDNWDNEVLLRLTLRP